MDKFLVYNLPKLIQEEIGHMKSHLTINKIDSELRISQRKLQTLGGFTVEPSPPFKNKGFQLCRNYSKVE